MGSRENAEDLRIQDAEYRRDYPPDLPGPEQDGRAADETWGRPVHRPTYKVTFDRLGRNHNPPPLIAVADESADLELAILRHSRQFHGSRDRWVVLHGSEYAGYGRVFCGGRDGGSFTYTEIHELDAPIAYELTDPPKGTNDAH